LEQSRVAIVIPCYNEENTIGAVVRGCVDSADVLVVDDGSLDTSLAVALREGAQIVDTGGKAGYEGGIEIGLRTAFERGYDIVITIDADGEHDPKLAAAFVAAFKSKPGLGLVAGFRQKPQRLAEWIVCYYCRWRFGAKDVLCGMKGYSRQLLEDYFETGQPNLVNTWPALLWIANGNSFRQIEVTGTPRTDQPRFSSRFKANKAILKMLGPISALRVEKRLEVCDLRP
jgi:glycosyltransferase involved in cell wall biosynthesis